MRTLILIFSLIIIFCLSGCMGDAHYEQLKAGYYLSATDTKEDMVLGYQDGEYGIGIIDAMVFAVGQNDSFIILKQHPRDFPNESNKAVTNYYIIPIKDRISKSPEKNFYGPLTSEIFEQKRNELGLQNVDFTIIFKDIE